jgi:hypothetical protein
MGNGHCMKYVGASELERIKESLCNGAKKFTLWTHSISNKNAIVEACHIIQFIILVELEGAIPLDCFGLEG